MLQVMVMAQLQQMTELAQVVAGGKQQMEGKHGCRWTTN